DDVAGLEAHTGADVGQNGPEVEDHVRKRRVLLALAIDEPLDSGVARQRGFGVRDAYERAQRRERVEALGPGPLLVAALQVAARDVIAEGVPRDVTRGVLGPD